MIRSGAGQVRIQVLNVYWSRRRKPREVERTRHSRLSPPTWRGWVGWGGVRDFFVSVSMEKPCLPQRFTYDMQYILFYQLVH
jgi:hypothetical protein